MTLKYYVNYGLMYLGKIHCGHRFSMSNFSTLAKSELLLNDRNRICYEAWCRRTALDNYMEAKL